MTCYGTSTVRTECCVVTVCDMLWYIYCTDRVLWCGVTVCDMLWYIYCTEECCGVTVCDMLLVHLLYKQNVVL